MSTWDEMSSKIKDQWIRASCTGTSPLLGIGEFRDEQGYYIEVILNRKPTVEEAGKALSEIDGERVKYSIVGESGTLSVWSPPQPTSAPCIN